MNHTVTSKELLLQTAKQIAYTEGLSHVNIRRTAKESGIGIGTVYNYYSSKSDLILSILEDFWKSIFHNEFYDFKEHTNFLETCCELYTRLFNNLIQFQHFIVELDSLNDIEQGKTIETQYMHHIKIGLLKVLEQDTRISRNIWNTVFTKETFITFIFSNMLIMLKNGEENCDFLLEIIKKLLWK